MPTIESPLGKQNVSATQPMKRFVVSDEEQPKNTKEDFTAIEKELKEAREVKRNAGKFIDPATKKRLEILSGIGRATKDITIDGVIFSLRTLKGSELRAIIKVATQGEDGADSVFEARAQTLARVIYKIDGHELGIILGDDNIETITLYLQEMDEQVLQYIYNEYNNLVNAHKKKYSTIEEEVAEVSEALKKSSP